MDEPTLAAPLRGRRALVTGAGNGIGLAVVDELRAMGADVTAVDLDARAMDRLRAADAGVRCVVGDVTHEAVADEAVGDGVDLLCNNAGLLDGMALVDELSVAEWQRVLHVNLTAPFLFARRAIPAMVARGGGAIVNVSSVAGLRGARAGAAYTASKHGLIGLTRNIAATFGPQGVRCNAVCPGGTGFGSRGGRAPDASSSDRGAEIGRAHV